MIEKVKVIMDTETKRSLDGIVNGLSTELNNMSKILNAIEIMQNEIGNISGDLQKLDSIASTLEEIKDTFADINSAVNMNQITIFAEVLNQTGTGWLENKK